MPNGQIYFPAPDVARLWRTTMPERLCYRQSDGVAQIKKPTSSGWAFGCLQGEAIYQVILGASYISRKTSE